MIRSATFGGILIGSILAIFVFVIKYEVQDLESDLSVINESIDQERQSIHVLLAEWSHLNNPSRIRDLAKRHLGLRDIVVNQVTDLNQIPLKPIVVKDPVDDMLNIKSTINELLKR